MQQQSLSIWQTLRRRKAAMASIYVIVFAGLIALFAYLLAPDSSPDANRRIPELRARRPGFTRLFVKVPRPNPPERKSFLARRFTGQETSYKLLPVNKYFFRADTLVVSHYLDKGLQETQVFPVRSLMDESLLPPFDITKRTSVRKFQKAAGRQVITRKFFLLGTDNDGRDILSRVIVGTRVSIAAGVVAVLLSMTIGIILGTFSGYFGRKVDSLVMYLIDVLSAVPVWLLVFAITLTTGRGFVRILVAIGLAMSVNVIRTIRGRVATLRRKDFIKAAEVLGLSNVRIVFRHILPNMAGLLMVVALETFAAAIVMEAGLSFLGLGAQLPMPSWGLMIRGYYDFPIANGLCMVLVPGIAIVTLVCAFNILANSLRDVLAAQDARF